MKPVVVEWISIIIAITYNIPHIKSPNYKHY